MSRLGKDDLELDIASLAPEFPALVEKNRLNILRTLVEQAVRRNAETKPLERAFKNAYPCQNSSIFDMGRLLRLPDAAPISTPTNSNMHPDRAIQSQQAPDTRTTGTKDGSLHASLLAQSLLHAPSNLGKLSFDSLVALSPSQLQNAAHQPQACHALITALTSPYIDHVKRRRLLTAFHGHMVKMSLDTRSSRVVDAMWNGTRGLPYVRARLAEELARSESLLRESICGRAVWRNWKMDLYKRRQGDWDRIGREEEQQQQHAGVVDGGRTRSAMGRQPGGDKGAGDEGGRGGEKRGIEYHSKGGNARGIDLARERYARKKALEMEKSKQGRPAERSITKVEATGTAS